LLCFLRKQFWPCAIGGAMLGTGAAPRWRLAVVAAIASVTLVASERPEVVLADDNEQAEADAGNQAMAAPTSDTEPAAVPESEPAPVPDSEPAPVSEPALAESSGEQTAGDNLANANSVGEIGTPVCEGEFGKLGPKMTVVDLDPPGGCVAGQVPEDVFTQFVGGMAADCKPPTPDDGCHRYAVTRYASSCDLDPLKSMLGQRVSLTAGSSSSWPGFNRDGVYTKCDEAPHIQTRTLLYIGAAGEECDAAYCGRKKADPSTIDSQESEGCSWWWPFCKGFDSAAMQSVSLRVCCGMVVLLGIRMAMSDRAESGQ